jgi:hypothetical protein
VHDARARWRTPADSARCGGVAADHVVSVRSRRRWRRR